MHKRRLGAALAGTLLLVLASGGCSVTSGNTDRDSRRSAAERVLGGGLDIDLTDPPSRQQLGMKDGLRSAVLQLEDRKPFDVRIDFRDGHRLKTTGVVLIVTADTTTGPPSSLTVRRDGLSQDDLADVIRGAADDLGADRGRADAILEQSRNAGSGRSDVIRTLPTGVKAPDRLEVESVVTAAEGRVSVNYLVAWGLR
jgi:hypothetical protein